MGRVRGGSVAAQADTWSPDFLQTLLRDPSAASDERWRRWCAHLLHADLIGPAELHEWWDVIIEFDPVLSAYTNEPVATPDNTVVVAGSGKEHFKTFNVSTAAAILAAAAGVPVVKGVSQSVSAVSGAADILDVLGIRPVDHPAAITEALDRHGIACTAYANFCPRYAARYDGVFEKLTPASFFMPAAALCVRAGGYVLGLAHRDVMLAAAALQRIRPDITTGVVASTELTPGEMIDEHSDVGVARIAHLTDGLIISEVRRRSAPAEAWRTAVAHRPTHGGNAALVAAAVTSCNDTPVARLVELNAALIVTASRAGVDLDEATDQVRQARRSGRATRLLTTLTHLQ